MVCQKESTSKMAFLCPVRFKRAKRKKARDIGSVPLMGRITGSASIDTLVQVGLEKEDLFVSAETAKHPTMVILHDFQPCVEDELSVVKGTKVTVLYRDNDWVYVLADDGREGFIPHAYCVPLSLANDKTFAMTSTVKPSRPAAPPDYENVILIRNRAGDVTDVATYSTLRRETSMSLPSLQEEHIDNIDKSSSHHSSTTKTEILNSSHHSSGTKTEILNDSNDSSETVQSFEKRNFGRFIVLFNFVAQQENDTSVDRGEFVTLLNKDDPEWFWVMRSDRREGFVPRIFLCSADGQGEQNEESTHYPAVPARNHRGVGTTPGLLMNGQQSMATETKQNLMHSPKPNPYRPHPSTSSPKPISRGSMHSTLPRSFRPKDTSETIHSPKQPRSYHDRTDLQSSFDRIPPNKMENGHSHVHNDRLFTDNEISSSQRSLQRALENGQNGHNINGFQYGHAQEQPIKRDRLYGSNRDFGSSKQTRAPPQRTSFRQTNLNSYTPDVPNTPKRSNAPDLKDIQNSPTYVTMSANPVASAHETEYVRTRTGGAIRAVCLYDFRARGPDDLTVARGDVIFIASDTSVNKPNAKWLWVYSPASRRAGYVPSACVRRPDQPSPPSQETARQSQKNYHQSPILTKARPRDSHLLS